jgi:KUP system potassium uptake protein
MIVVQLRLCVQGWKSTLVLAWGTLGVIYGDIGTSPLYVYASVLTDGTPSEVDVMGVMSLIFYTLTLLALIKYVLVVLRADDNGEGRWWLGASSCCGHLN